MFILQLRLFTKFGKLLDISVSSCRQFDYLDPFIRFLRLYCESECSLSDLLRADHHPFVKKFLAMGQPAATPIALSVIFPALAISAVALRLYARYLKALKLQSDDYMILPSLVILLYESHVLRCNTNTLLGHGAWLGRPWFYRCAIAICCVCVKGVKVSEHQLGAFHGNFAQHQSKGPNGPRITAAEIVVFNKV